VLHFHHTAADGVAAISPPASLVLSEEAKKKRKERAKKVDPDFELTTISDQKGYSYDMSLLVLR
jgi:hypothetical protein